MRMVFFCKFTDNDDNHMQVYRKRKHVIFSNQIFNLQKCITPDDSAIKILQNFPNLMKTY